MAEKIKLMSRDGEPFFGKGGIDLPLMGGKYFRLYGGPFQKWPASSTKGICVAVEHMRAKEANYLLPIVDFSTPDPKKLVQALDAALDMVRRRNAVYVGCMGGIGRTGLFLASMLKLWGDENPVNTVRANYYEHAVETSDQRKFIDDLKFPLALRTKVAMLKVSGLLPSKAKLLNPVKIAAVVAQSLS